MFKANFKNIILFTILFNLLVVTKMILKHVDNQEINEFYSLMCLTF